MIKHLGRIILTSSVYALSLVSAGNLVSAQEADRCRVAKVDGKTIVRGVNEYVLSNDIAEKWLSLGGPYGAMGCPTGDERLESTSSEETLGIDPVSYRVADFENGQIISNPLTGRSYSLSPFFEQLRNRFSTPALYALGLPISDVESGTGISEFQLFQPPGSPWINSMEMHIDPPTLYVARHPVVTPQPPYDPDTIDPETRTLRFYSDTRVYRETLEISNWRAQWLPGRGPAPKWESYRCTSTSGPCDFSVTSQDTFFFADSNAVCFGTTFPFGPPQWADVLHAFADGTGDWIDRGIASANELHALVQRDPARAMSLLQWQGRPSEDDWDNRRPIYWYSSWLEGITTNSKLAGEDFQLTHRPRPAGWWLGDPPYPRPFYRTEDCGFLLTQNSLCNDWNLFIKPDPEYNYLVAARGRLHEGNFGEEHRGNMENEIEQWQIPGGYRPTIGDRVLMLGRWIVDCGHDNFASEIHPMELIVSSRADVSEEGDVRGVESRLTITSSWIDMKWSDDGLQVLNTSFDVYPPARPYPDAQLVMENNEDMRFGINVQVEKIPPENPNHVRVTITSSVEQLFEDQGRANDLFYAKNRRLASVFRLYWK